MCHADVNTGPQGPQRRQAKAKTLYLFAATSSECHHDLLANRPNSSEFCYDPKDFVEQSLILKAKLLTTRAVSGTSTNGIIRALLCREAKGEKETCPPRLWPLQTPPNRHPRRGARTS